VKTNMSADALRSLSLFITYSLHKYCSTRPLKVRKSNVQLKRQAALDATNPSSRHGGDIKGDDVTKQRIGIMVLEMYVELLCDDDPSAVNIKKFARTVTNKVLLTLTPIILIPRAFLICFPLVVAVSSCRKRCRSCGSWGKDTITTACNSRIQLC